MVRSSRTLSPLWHQALERYREELQGSEDYDTILKIHSLQGLIGSLSSVRFPASGDYSGLLFLHRLAPRLKFVDDFSAVLALCFGADATLTATVWGSIRLILDQASSAAETLKDVLDMLEELSLTLPRFQVYEESLPLDRELNLELVDVYSEIICFYARTIHFLRSNPHLVLRKNAWQTFQSDFSRTLMRIKRMSSHIEGEVDMIRMRKDESRYHEVLQLLGAIKMDKEKEQQQQPVRYNNIPFSLNPKFSDRRDILDTIHSTLNWDASLSLTKSVALFGMGGVGKTQIAVQYAYQHLEDFDAILWVAADNGITIGQSFCTIAEGLGLSKAREEAKDAAAAIWAVKNWLRTTKTACLIVFDNSDDLAALKTVQTGSRRSSVLVTTRDSTIATALATQQIQVTALTEDAGSKMLLKAIGSENPSPSDTQHATAISRAFGGLPLALTQIGGFVTQRKLSLQDFLPLYDKYSSKIDSRKIAGSDYEHTLSTVWDVSFKKLTEDSTRLLNVLSYFDPDCIPEEILSQGSDGLDDEFAFLSDEMDLGDASEELLRAALVNRTGETAVLTIHRLVQSAARKRMSEADSIKMFDTVVHMLCWGFPDHSKVDIGHQVSAWTRCEKCLPHVNRLVELFDQPKNNVMAGDKQKYANLLLRCSWYLYEREMYLVARRMVNQAISMFEDTTTLAYASGIDLGGLLDLDLTESERALVPFQKALEIRKACLGPEDPFIAYSLNNIALAYTEMNELQLAYAAHEEVIALRLKANSDRIGNSYSNMSSLLLRLGRPDEAEEMLARCPSLKDFTDETFLKTGNPRFSGDMVLLSRIRRAQGRSTEALRLASKALAFRRTLLGNRLKTCDSQYDVASMLLDDGHMSSAVQLLEEIVGISETFVEGEGQRARALYKLSVIHRERGMIPSSEACKKEALKLRAKLKPELEDNPFEEVEFAKLCVWMLW